jgi:hypothetical protein
MTEMPDPDGSEVRSFVHNKFHLDHAFEVFKVTDTEIQIRYEVIKGEWIRRFEERDREGQAHGHVWMRRFMEPGGPGFTSRAAIDAYAYNPNTRQYVWDTPRSTAETEIYYSVEWATIDWQDANETGFDLNPVLRLVSEWQKEGKVFETYDYAKGKGIVNWRWLEWLDGHIRNRPLEGGGTRPVFRCEAGHVYVESFGTEEETPVVYQYDVATGTKGRQLEVVSRPSHRAPEDGPRWYVACRDIAKEHTLEKREESLCPDYDLPRWKGGLYTLSDLPAHYTTPFKRKKPEQPRQR